MATMPVHRLVSGDKVRCHPRADFPNVPLAIGGIKEQEPRKPEIRFGNDVGQSLFAPQRISNSQVDLARLAGLNPLDVAFQSRRGNWIIAI